MRSIERASLDRFPLLRAADGCFVSDVAVCGAALSQAELDTAASHADKTTCEDTGGGGKCQYSSGEWQSAPGSATASRECTEVTVCDPAATQIATETFDSDASCECNSGYFGDGASCSAWSAACDAVEGCEAIPKLECAAADLSAATAQDRSLDCAAVGGGSKCTYVAGVTAVTESCTATDTSSSNSNADEDVAACASLDMSGTTASYDRATCEECGGTGDTCILHQSTSGRCTYTEAVEASPEACVAVDEALCAAVDVSGTDDAADDATCAATGGGSRCRYFAGSSAADATQFTSRDPTTLVDRECSTLAVCGADEWETVAAAPSSNRACRAVTVCLETEVETAAPTATSDRGCAPAPPAPAGEDEVEVQTRTQFENRCVMSQFVPAYSSPFSIIEGCTTAASIARACSVVGGVPNILSYSAYVKQVIDGVGVVRRKSHSPPLLPGLPLSSLLAVLCVAPFGIRFGHQGVDGVRREDASKRTLAKLTPLLRAQVEACAGLCFADIECIAFMYGVSDYVLQKCVLLRAVPQFYSLALGAATSEDALSEVCEPINVDHAREAVRSLGEGADFSAEDAKAATCSAVDLSGTNTAADDVSCTSAGTAS